MKCGFTFRLALLALSTVAVSWLLFGQVGKPAVATTPDEDNEPTRALVRSTVAEIVKTDKFIRLNLGAKAPNHRIIVLIPAQESKNYTDLDLLEGQPIQVIGDMTDLAGRGVITLKSPKQLTLLKQTALAKVAAPVTGEQAVIRGPLAEVIRTVTVIRLNLGGKAPDHRATALIYPDHFADFPDLEALIGKDVEISGAELNYPGRKHVLLANKTQIAMLRAAPAPVVAAGPSGPPGTIRGLVAEVVKTDKVIRLNLGAKAPDHRSTAVIYYENFEAFPNVDKLTGQTIEVAGPLDNYGGRPQITLVTTNQLAFLGTQKQ
ncbi:MAG: hypothetical protein WCO56_13390 [Verrucomicrobiota bacterium]